MINEEINIYEFTNNILDNTELFHIERIDNNEDLINEIFNAYLEYVPVLADIAESPIEKFYYIYIELSKENYQQQVMKVKQLGKKVINKEGVIFLTPINNNPSQFVLYHYLQIQTSKKRRKTILELEIELEEAVKNEKYELAQKIKSKIDLKNRVHNKN